MILRPANYSELPVIWEILQQAIEQRKRDGSPQWQDGYPNEQSVRDDLQNGYAYVLAEGGTVLAYAALIFDGEPVYEHIEGRWLTDGGYMVVHRVATSAAARGRGIATRLFEMMEDLCIEKKVYSIKVDTHSDNVPMLKIFDRLGYAYCGEVFFRGSARRAYEKVLA